MTFRRRRFTVRWLMIVVAIVAAAFGLRNWMGRRSQTHIDRSVEHIWMSGASSISRDGNSRWRDYHRRLADKYMRAARYPWLPVEADPPEPE